VRESARYEPGAAVAGRVSERSRKTRVRFFVSLALTLDALIFTLFSSAAHAGLTPIALTASAVGIFATTWFLLDLGIAWQADLQRRRGRR